MGWEYLFWNSACKPELVFALRVPSPGHARLFYNVHKLRLVAQDHPALHKQSSNNGKRLRVPDRMKSTSRPIQEYHSSAFRFRAIPIAAPFFAHKLLADARAPELPIHRRNPAIIHPDTLTLQRLTHLLMLYLFVFPTHLHQASNLWKN